MIQPQYQSYGYDTFLYCPSTSPIDTTVPVLLIRHNTLLPQYQPYVYDTVHNNLSTSFVDVHYCHNASPTNTTQITTLPVPVLLILHSPPMPQYQSNDTTQSPFVAVHVLLIWYSLPQPSTSPTDTTVYFCPSTSPGDMIQSTTAPIQYQSY